MMANCRYCGGEATCEFPLLFSEPRRSCAAHEADTARLVRAMNRRREQLLAGGNAIEECIDRAENEGFDDEAAVARNELAMLRAGLTPCNAPSTAYPAPPPRNT